MTAMKSDQLELFSISLVTNPLPGMEFGPITYPTPPCGHVKLSSKSYWECQAAPHDGDQHYYVRDPQIVLPDAR